VRTSGSRHAVLAAGESSVRNFFGHRMTTYAAALAYRGLFGLFPFVLLLVVLASALGLSDFLKRLLEQANSQPFWQLKPVVEQGMGHIQLLKTMIDQAEVRAEGELLFLGLALALWSTSALARTLTEALNAAYRVAETRPGWKRFALSVAFGPVLALMVIVSVGMILIGPRLIERVAGVVGLDEAFLFLWTWLRFPVALFLLAMVVSFAYRYGPNVNQRFRSVRLGAAISVLLWSVASVGFSIYLATFADYGATYGSLGAAVGLLFYLYLSASVVLMGAEVNAAIYHALPHGVRGAQAPRGLINEPTDTRRRRRDA
jgi:membrane protein